MAVYEKSHPAALGSGLLVGFVVTAIFVVEIVSRHTTPDNVMDGILRAAEWTLNGLRLSSDYSAYFLRFPAIWHMSPSWRELHRGRLCHSDSASLVLREKPGLVREFAEVVCVKFCKSVQGPPGWKGFVFFSRLAENAYGFAFTDGVFVGPWPVQDEQ
jgi:hypothetical protein